MTGLLENDPLANTSRLESLSDDQPVQMSLGLLTKLLQMCKNDTEAVTKPDDDGNSKDAFLYILVVLLFYAFAMVILMVKYIKREEHEAELSYYFSEFVNRDKFHAARYQNRQKVKAVKSTLMSGLYKPLEQYSQNMMQAFQKTTLQTLQSSPVPGVSGSNIPVACVEDVIVEEEEVDDVIVKNVIPNSDADKDYFKMIDEASGTSKGTDPSLKDQAPTENLQLSCEVDITAPLACEDTPDDQCSRSSSPCKITSV